MYWRDITDADRVESEPAPNRGSFLVNGSPVSWSSRTGGDTGYAERSFGEKYACLAFCAARDTSRTPEERAAAVAEFERLDALQRA